MLPERTESYPTELLREHQSILPSRVWEQNENQTESNNTEVDKINNIIFKNYSEQAETISFQCLQKWEGTVIEIEEESFTAELNDITAKNPIEIAEILNSDVVEDDKALLKCGAIFYLEIGFSKSLQGTVTRGTHLRFRRLPAWTKKEIIRGKSLAVEISNELEWK